MLLHADWMRASGLWRWPHFTPHELACSCCDILFFDPDFFDALQALRNAVDLPLWINSGHRCGVHNARVGGAPLSEHRHMAVDISLRGHNRVELRDKAAAAGFTGFGYYQTFLHLDKGRARFWFSSEVAKDLWQ